MRTIKKKRNGDPISRRRNAWKERVRNPFGEIVSGSVPPLRRLRETDRSASWSADLHLPSVCHRTFFRTWINHKKTTWNTPKPYDGASADLWPYTWPVRNSRSFLCSEICVFGPVLKEKKKKIKLYETSSLSIHDMQLVCQWQDTHGAIIISHHTQKHIHMHW